MTRRVLRTFRSFVGRDDTHVLYECRHCGTTLDGADDRCPACGTTEIARYQF